MGVTKKVTSWFFMLNKGKNTLPLSTNNQNNLYDDSLPAERNWKFSVIVHKFPHYVKFDMLLVMMESTVMAKSLVHINCLENVWDFFS